MALNCLMRRASTNADPEQKEVRKQYDFKLKAEFVVLMKQKQTLEVNLSELYTLL